MASSGLVALDVVLREREAIAAISDVVRLLRQFADTPLLIKLHHACDANASAGDLERIVAAHGETQQLDTHSGPSAQQQLMRHQSYRRHHFNDSTH